MDKLGEKVKMAETKPLSPSTLEEQTRYLDVKDAEKAQPSQSNRLPQPMPIPENVIIQIEESNSGDSKTHVGESQLPFDSASLGTGNPNLYIDRTQETGTNIALCSWEHRV